VNSTILVGEVSPGRNSTGCGPGLGPGLSGGGTADAAGTPLVRRTLRENESDSNDGHVEMAVVWFA
jgi:hypothetical protein